MLLGATAGFVGVAVASVFQCVAARSGFLDGIIAALVAGGSGPLSVDSWRRALRLRRG